MRSDLNIVEDLWFLFQDYDWISQGQNLNAH